VNISYHLFYATCRTKHDNMSTISITKFSSLERSTLDFPMLKPQKTLHSLNTFFAHDSTCLLALQSPLFTCSISFSSRPRMWDFGMESLTLDTQKWSLTTWALISNVRVSKFIWIMKPKMWKKHEHYKYIHMRFQKKWITIGI